ncbi:MAG: hypothetical protein AABX75_01710 [Nanoarchaeota archaeon]
MLYTFFYPPEKPKYVFILGEDTTLHTYIAGDLTREEFIAQLPHNLTSGRVCFFSDGEVKFQKFNVQLDVLRAGLKAVQKDPQRPIGVASQASMMLTCLADITQEILTQKLADVQRKRLTEAIHLFTNPA